MQSSLTGFRRPTFRFTSVNAGGTPLGVLPSVWRDEGGLDLSQQATIRGSGDLSRAVADGAISDRIKVEYVLDQDTPHEKAWPLGVYYSASPVTAYNSMVASSSVEIYDGLLVLHEDAIPTPLHLPVGTNPVAEVLYQLTLVGANRYAVVQTTKTLKAAMTFKAGTTRLQIINQLLAAADYWAIWCDGDGVYQIQPYVEPAQRPIEWRFLPGRDSIFSADVEVEDDIYAVPNRVIGLSRTTGEEPPLTATATITDTSSPYHFNNLGRWRTEVLEDVDVTEQADLQKKVNRRLLEASTVARKVTLRHGWVPITINSVVYLDAFGVTGRFVVINQAIPFDPKELVTSTLREVVG